MFDGTKGLARVELRALEKSVTGNPFHFNRLKNVVEFFS